MSACIQPVGLVFSVTSGETLSRQDLSVDASRNECSLKKKPPQPERHILFAEWAGYGVS